MWAMWEAGGTTLVYNCYISPGIQLLYNSYRYLPHLWISRFKIMMLVLINRDSTPQDIPYCYKLREVAVATSLPSGCGCL